jgi:hypothetical protein
MGPHVDSVKLHFVSKRAQEQGDYSMNLHEHRMPPHTLYFSSACDEILSKRAVHAREMLAIFNSCGIYYSESHVVTAVEQQAVNANHNILIETHQKLAQEP